MGLSQSQWVWSGVGIRLFVSEFHSHYYTQCYLNHRRREWGKVFCSFVCLPKGNLEVPREKNRCWRGTIIIQYNCICEEDRRIICENCFLSFFFSISNPAAQVSTSSCTHSGTFHNDMPLNAAILISLVGSYDQNRSWSYSTSVFADRNSEKPFLPDGKTNVLKIKGNFIFMF